MKRKSLILLSALTAASLSGCAICCSPYLDHYPTFGGRVQRADPQWGRVGSIFSDPYTAGTGPDADSNLARFDRQSPRKERIDLDERPKDIDLPADELQNPQPLETPLPPPKKDGETTHSRPLNGRNGWRSGPSLR